MPNPPNRPEYIWSSIDSSGGLDTCWIWLDGVDRDGYGLFNLGGRQRRVHQIMYEMMYGPIPEGHGVLHTCDNPPCCNPSHLWSGTPNANNQDMIAKTRHVHGEDVHTAVLTATLVVDIRRRLALGERASDLARELNVTQANISLIKHRKIWKTAS